MSCSFACPCSFPSPVEALFFSSSAYPLGPLHIAANLSLSFRCRCQRLPSGQPSQHLEYKRRNISICWLYHWYHSILNCSYWANYLSKYIGCILARTKCILYTCIDCWTTCPMAIPCTTAAVQEQKSDFTSTLYTAKSQYWLHKCIICFVNNKTYIQYTPRGFPTFHKTPRKIFRAENLTVFPMSVFLWVFSIFPPRTFYRPS